MINLKIQYYIHLLLNNKYAFIFKIIIICFIYLVFHYNNLILCTYELELEKIRIEEKLIAYTNLEPEQLLQKLEEWKQQQQGRSIPGVYPDTLTYENLSNPFHEKRFLASLKLNGFSKLDRHLVLSSKEDVRETYSLLRMYRRLSQISMASLVQEQDRTQIVQEESKNSSFIDYFSSCNIS